MKLWKRLCAVLLLVGTLTVCAAPAMAEEGSGSASTPILVITEVCFNPTYIEDNPYGLSKSEDVFEYVEIYNLSNETVSLADATLQYANEGYTDESIAVNKLYALSSSPRILAPGEMAVITVYGSGTVDIGMAYDSDEALTAYYDAFAEFYGCEDLVDINHFYIAPRYESGSKTKIDNGFNLANSHTDVVLRVVSGETVLAEASYNAELWNKNNTALNMMYYEGALPEHPLASVVLNDGGTNVGFLYDNQLPNESLTPAEGADTLPIKVMHYNVCSTDCTQTNADGSAFSMDQRIEGVFNVIKKHDADVMGFCEVNYVWVPEFKETFTSEEGEYDGFGMSSQGCLYSGDKMNMGQTWDFTNLILWKRDKYDLVDSGYFWCSALPSRPNSFTWAGGLTGDFARCINWVILEDKESGAQFFFMCGHIDAKYAEVRTLSTALIREKIAELSHDLPVIVVGDWNCSDNKEAYWNLYADGLADARYRVARVEDMTVRGTFNKWGVNDDIQARLPIDLCFVSTDDVFVNSAVMDVGYYDEAQTLFSSDHHATVYDIQVLKEHTVEPETEPETEAATEPVTEPVTNAPETDTEAATLPEAPSTGDEAIESLPEAEDTAAESLIPAETDAQPTSGCGSVLSATAVLVSFAGAVPALCVMRKKKE